MTPEQRTIEEPIAEKPRESEHHPDTQTESPEQVRDVMRSEAEREVLDFQKDTMQMEATAKADGLEIDPLDQKELEELMQEAGLAKQTLLERLSGFIKGIPGQVRGIIPKRIDKDYQAAERSGALKEVEADEAFTKTPPRPKSSSVGKWAVPIAAALVGLAEGPKTVDLAEKGIDAVHDFIDDAGKTVGPIVDSIIDTVSKKAQATERKGGKEYKDIAERRLGMFLEAHPKLDEKGKEHARELFKKYEKGTLQQNYGDFVLFMELANGQINERQYQEAKKMLSDLETKIRNELSKEPGALEDPARIAEAIAEQRTMYVEKSSTLSHLLKTGEGNCQALEEDLLSLLGRLYKKPLTIKTQIFSNHERVIYSVPGNKAMFAVEGHSVIPLTNFDGSDIQDPMTLVRETLDPEKRGPETHPKTEGGVETDAVLHRVAKHDTKKFSQGPIPERKDEREEIKRAKAARAENNRIVSQPIEVDIPVGAPSDVTPSNNEQEKNVPIIRAPEAVDIASAIETGGALEGAFNDLSTVENMHLKQLILSNPDSKPTSVDISKIHTDALTWITLDESMKLTGFEKKSFEKIHGASIHIDQEGFLQKLATEATLLTYIEVNIPSDLSEAQQKDVLDNGPKSEFVKTHENGLGAIVRKLMKQKSGNVSYQIAIPNDPNDGKIKWSFSGATQIWDREEVDSGGHDH